MKEPCGTCTKEINTERHPHTVCTACDKTFCCDLTSYCYVNHARDCEGSRFVTILDPAYKLNLAPIET